MELGGRIDCKHHDGTDEAVQQEGEPEPCAAERGEGTRPGQREGKKADAGGGQGGHIVAGK